MTVTPCVQVRGMVPAATDRAPAVIEALSSFDGEEVQSGSGSQALVALMCSPSARVATVVVQAKTMPTRVSDTRVAFHIPDLTHGMEDVSCGVGHQTMRCIGPS